MQTALQPFNRHSHIETTILAASPFVKPYFNDLDADAAAGAYNGTSHSPEDRGAYLRADYARHLLADQEEVKKTIERAIKKGADVAEDWEQSLAVWFEEHRKGLKQAYTTYINARSRCISAFITGPARFPVSRAEKFNKSADKRWEEVQEFSCRSKKRFTNDLLPYGDGSAIRTDDPNAVNKLEKKVTDLCAARDMMKEANKVIRKYFKRGKLDISDESRTACITELNELFKDSKLSVEELLKPNYAGKVVGFEAYALTNIGAQIRTAEKRVNEVKNAQDAEINDDFGNGISAEISTDSKIVIFFPDIPAEEVRSLLKSKAFKWSRQRGAWVRKVTDNALATYERDIKPVLADIE